MILANIVFWIIVAVLLVILYLEYLTDKLCPKIQVMEYPGVLVWGIRKNEPVIANYLNKMYEFDDMEEVEQFYKVCSTILADKETNGKK